MDNLLEKTDYINSLPEGWKIKRTKYEFTIINGSTPDTNYSEYWDGNINWIGPADMQEFGEIKEGRNTITLSGYNSCSTLLLPEGSIVISTRAPIGKVNITIGELCTNQGCKSLVRKNKDNRYFYYHFHMLKEKLISLGRGTTFKELSTTDLKNVYIIIPPDNEQRIISSFLDEKVPMLNNAISALNNEIKLLEDAKKSLITESITCGLNKNGELLENDNPIIRFIPQNWKCIKIKYIAKFYNGDRSEKYPKDYEIVEEGIPFLNSENIHGEVVDTSLKCKYITNEKYSELGGAKLQINDIIFCLRGSIGLCAINKTEKKGTIASSLVAIRANNSILPDFLNYYLSSEIVKTQTIQCMNGSCAANLSADDVKKYFISMPDSLKEQQEIVDYLDKKCGAIDRIIETKRKQIEKLETHKLSMIYDYVTGIKRVGGTA